MKVLDLSSKIWHQLDDLDVALAVGAALERRRRGGQLVPELHQVRLGSSGHCDGGQVTVAWRSFHGH